MDNVWVVSTVWMGLAFLACLIAIRVPIAVALIEITIGAVAANVIPLVVTEWVSYFASLGALLLVFLAGAETRPEVFRTHFRASFSVGIVSFLLPYLACIAFARYGLGWNWAQSQIAGLTMAMTSVAVVYTAIVETGLNRATLGMVILAACFLTNFAAVVTLGGIFTEFDWRLAAFVAVLGIAIVILPRITPWLFAKVGNRLSEPRVRFLLLVLFAMAAAANSAKIEDILPAFVLGIALAPYFAREPEAAHRLRTIAFSVITPFFFMKAGALIDATALWDSLALTGSFLGLKILAKFAGIAPSMVLLRYTPREIAFTCLVMSSGLTFDLIVAGFGLAAGIIDGAQYAALSAAVILSGVLPSIVASLWFQPKAAKV